MASSSSSTDSHKSSSAVVIGSEAFKCRNCSNDYNDVPYSLKCGHYFCLPCIENMRKAAKERQETKFECPTCSYGQDVRSNLVPNHFFRFIRDHMKSTEDFILQSQEYKTLRQLVDLREIFIHWLERSHRDLRDTLKCEMKLSASIRAELNTAKEKIHKLKEDAIIENRTAIDSQRVLREKIKKFQANVFLKKNGFEVLQEVISHKERLNVTVCAKLEVLERENDTTKEEVRVLKEEIQELQADLVLETDKSAKIQEVMNSERELNATTGAKLEVLKRENETLKEENQKLRADLVLEASKSAEFQEVINRKEEQNAVSCAKLEVLGRENEKLKLNIKDTKATISGLRETINREKENAVCALKTLEQEKQKYINDIAREKNEILERQKAFDDQKEQYKKAIEAEKKKAQQILYIPCAVTACFVAYFLYRL